MKLLIELFLITTIFVLTGCTENSIKSIKEKIDDTNLNTDVYGKYAYVSNTENLKMNGVVELSYEKRGDKDSFYGSVDVDKTISGVPESCELNGELFFVEKNTYQLRGSELNKFFTLTLIIKNDQINLTGIIDSALCSEKITDAVFQKYTKVN